MFSLNAYSTRLKNAGFIFLFLILLSFSVFANYPERGLADHSYFIDGRTIFNDLYNSIYGIPDTFSVSVNNIMQQPPLIFDLNNNGQKYLIAASGSTIRVYSDKEFDLVNTTTATGTIVHYKIYDYNNQYFLVVDSDSLVTFPAKPAQHFIYTEVFNWSNNNFHKISKRNNTNINVTTYTTYSPAITYDLYPSQHNVECQSGICWAFENHQLTRTNLVDGAFYTVMEFNIDDTTNISTSVALFNAPSYPSNNKMFALPQINDLYVGDIRNVGTKDLVLTAALYDVVANDFTPKLKIFYDNSGVITEINQDLETVTINTGSDVLNLSMQTQVSSFITSPLVGNFVPDGVVGQSVVLGYLDSFTGFRVHSYYWTGLQFHQYARHPDLYSFVGDLLSNPFRAKVWNVDNNNNYCVLAYKQSNQTVIDCATDYGGTFNAASNPVGLTEKIFYTLNNTNSFFPNSTTAEGLVHSIFATNNIQNNRKMSDFILPFGIYKQDSCDILQNCLLSPIFGVNYGRGMLTPADLKNTGLYDLIFSSQNSITYIDDKQENQNAKVDSITVNPCLSTAWHIDTRVNVQVIVKDNELNNVRANAILYYGTPAAQEANYTAFFPSGSLFIFDFNATSLVANGVLRVMAQDDQLEHNNTNSTRDYPFTVTATGANYGDCQTTYVDLINQDAIAQQAAQAPQSNATFNGHPITNSNNALKSAIDSIALVSGMPTLIFLLIVIAGMNIVILIASLETTGLKEHLFTVAIVLFAIDIIIIFIASLMTIISSAFAISILVGLVIIGIIYAIILLSKVNSGNG